MNHSLRVLYHMMKADFLERVRRYSFLLTLAGALWLAYGVIAEKVTIVVGDGYRGVYNSAWIGMLMAINCSTFLSLCGFYVVKNSVERDSITRVGRILAATPMRKEFYTIAKTLSNFAVLASMVLVLMVAAVAMQWLRPEARPISLWELWSPFLFISLPAMLVTASLAVLFETLPGLRGGFGNVIYFFLWTLLLLLGAETGIDDPAGLHIFSTSTQQALRKMNLSGGKDTSFSLTIGGNHAMRTFLWNGVDWTLHVLLWRLLWLAAGFGIAWLASVFFHRFDPARERLREKTPQQKRTAVELPIAAEPANAQLAQAALTPLGQHRRSRFARLVFSELSLMVKGLRWWWYVMAAGLLIAEFASPTAEARAGVLLVAWLWPVLVWSQMGSREARYATQSLIFSAERVVYRQLIAVWAAGVIVALLAGAGTGFRLLFSANWPMLAAWVAGALFIPSLALALGVWSGSGKFFEALYTVWWYVGPLHQLPSLDFVGGSPTSSSPVLFLSLAAGLLLASCLGRRRQVAYA
jgi:hypothetical protein